MTDFETRLRTRLERLDAAIPAPRPPSVWAVDGRLAGMAPARPARPRRGRRVVLLLAAAALLTATSVATAQRFLFPDVPQPALEAAVAEVFAQSGCVTATDAKDAIRALLDASGHADWEIESRGGADHARCVTAGLLTTEHVVLLLPGAGRDVAEAMAGVAEELMRRCLGKDEATQLVSSVLTSLGETDFSVRADPGGPQGGPIDQIEAYRSHVAAGCFVYSGGVGRDADGHANYYLWGP
jgi:hypothetical protein